MTDTNHTNTDSEPDWVRNSQPPASRDEVTADSPYTLPGFFDALGDGHLLGVRCTDCETHLVPPRTACYACGSRDVRLEEQPREGFVYSYTEVRIAPPAFASLAPFTVAIVELDSGARLTGRLAVPYEDTSIGMPVRLTVQEPTDAEREAALSYETEWPLHVFEAAPRE